MEIVLYYVFKYFFLSVIRDAITLHVFCLLFPHHPSSCSNSMPVLYALQKLTFSVTMCAQLFRANYGTNYDSFSTVREIFNAVLPRLTECI